MLDGFFNMGQGANKNPEGDSDNFEQKVD